MGWDSSSSGRIYLTHPPEPEDGVEWDEVMGGFE